MDYQNVSSFKILRSSIIKLSILRRVEESIQIPYYAPTFLISHNKINRKHILQLLCRVHWDSFIFIIEISYWHFFMDFCHFWTKKPFYAVFSEVTPQKNIYFVILHKNLAIYDKLSHFSKKVLKFQWMNNENWPVESSLIITWARTRTRLPLKQQDTVSY